MIFRRWLKNRLSVKGNSIKQKARGDNVTQIAVIGDKRSYASTKIDPQEEQTK
jgi:hypothetical protein